MKRVRKVKNYTYKDGDGKKYYFKEAIIIDLTGKDKLENLLKKAIELELGDKNNV